MTIRTGKLKQGQPLCHNRALANCKELIEFGASPIRVASGGKKALETGWSTAATRDLATFAAELQPGENVGIRLGEPSFTQWGYLHALDLDCRDPSKSPEAMAALDKVLPEAARAFVVNTGSGTGQHYIFFSPEPLESRKLAKGDGWEIDLKGRRHVRCSGCPRCPKRNGSDPRQQQHHRRPRYFNGRQA